MPNASTPPPVIQGLLEVFSIKYAGEHFDAIIVSDDDAFNFALKSRPQLFPGVPIIFCGINDLGEDELAVGNLTGVIESFDLLGTVDVALKLHPEKRQYLSLPGTPMTEAAIASGFLGDVYVALGEEAGQGAWTVRAYHKPFVTWIWGGCLLMALGGVLAILDRRYRATVRQPDRDQAAQPGG